MSSFVDKFNYDNRVNSSSIWLRFIDDLDKATTYFMIFFISFVMY